MKHQQLNVSFAIHTPQGLLWEHDTRFQQSKCNYLDMKDLSGYFRISFNRISEPLVIQDDIFTLAWGFGTEAIRALVNAQDYMMQLCEAQKTIKFVNLGEQVELIIDDVPVRKLPRLDLARELLACTRRLSMGLSRLGSANKSLIEAVDALDQAVAEISKLL